jgi:hypothetical protein
MDYRGLGFLATVIFGPFSLHPFIPYTLPLISLTGDTQDFGWGGGGGAQKMKKVFCKSVSELIFTTNSGLGEPASLSQFFCVSPVELTEGRGGDSISQKT